MNERIPDVEEALRTLCGYIDRLPDDDARIDALNYIRSRLHAVSPLAQHPVDFVAWERADSVEGNAYNPNAVAPPEMSLLVTSIEQDGYTMPIVTNPEEDTLRIVDGFHRRKAAILSDEIRRSTLGRLPVTFIRESQRGLGDRMASTIRHNRARGSHDIDLMASIVRELTAMGKSTQWIQRHVGMDPDEILRLKQLTGLADLFADREFSPLRTGKGWMRDPDP